MRYFKLKDFDKLQHYKDRNPPWIKLYNNQILDDYHFGNLPDSMKYQILAIGSLASRYNNKLPLDSKWVQTKIQSCAEVNFEQFLHIGFIEVFEDETEGFDLKVFENQKVNEVCIDASKPLATCSENARPETETETETETDLPPISPKRGKRVCANKSFEQFWTAYPRKQNRGRAEKAWQSLAPNEQLTVQILQAVERAKTSEDWRKEGGRFIPQPASWLNAKGWLDEGLDLKALNTAGSRPPDLPNLPKPPTDEEREASLQAMREAKKNLPWLDLGGGDSTLPKQKVEAEKPPEEPIIPVRSLDGLINGLTGKLSMTG